MFIEAELDAVSVMLLSVGVVVVVGVLTDELPPPQAIRKLRSSRIDTKV